MLWRGEAEKEVTEGDPGRREKNEDYYLGKRC